MGRPDAVEAVPPASTTEDRLRLIIDSVPALSQTVKPDGYLDYFNKCWLEYPGVTLDAVTGWTWTARIYPEDVEGIVGKFRAARAGGELLEAEGHVRRGDGQTALSSTADCRRTTRKAPLLGGTDRPSISRIWP